MKNKLIKSNKINKISLVLILLTVIIFMPGCKMVDNISTMTWECEKESLDANGYKTIDKLTIKARDQYIKNLVSETLYEVDENSIESALEYGNKLSDAIKNCKGVSLKYTKHDDKTLKIVTKVDYEKVHQDELKNALGTYYSETDPMLSGKQVEFAKYKALYLKDYVCK